jgi:hypothetical protein
MAAEGLIGEQFSATDFNFLVDSAMRVIRM